MISSQLLKLFQREKKRVGGKKRKHCLSTNFYHILQSLSLDHKRKGGKPIFELGIRVQSSNNGNAHSMITVDNFPHHDNIIGESLFGFRSSFKKLRRQLNLEKSCVASMRACAWSLAHIEIKSQGMTLHNLNPNSTEAETQISETHWPISLAYIMSFRAVKDLVKRNMLSVV